MTTIRTILISAAIAVTAMAQQTLLIVTNSLPSGTVGVSYSATVTANGGTTPYTWTATNLPPGLVINSSSGIISGSPTAAGTFNNNVGVTDFRGFQNFKQFSITIVAGVARV